MQSIGTELDDIGNVGIVKAGCEQMSGRVREGSIKPKWVLGDRWLPHHFNHLSSMIENSVVLLYSITWACYGAQTNMQGHGPHMNTEGLIVHNAFKWDLGPPRLQ